MLKSTLVKTFINLAQSVTLTQDPVDFKPTSISNSNAISEFSVDKRDFSDSSCIYLFILLSTVVV